MANDNLRKAKKAKNDEFYTDINDIIMELAQHKDYVRQFQGKTVRNHRWHSKWPGPRYV